MVVGLVALLDGNAMWDIRPEGGKGFVYQDQDVRRLNRIRESE